MFEKGERIHLHDGSVHAVDDSGLPPPPEPGREHVPIRGFIRGALVDCLTGEQQVGDWHENVITQAGHQMVIRNFIGLVSTDSAAMATGTAQMGWARYWGIGSVTNTDATRCSTLVNMDQEYGSASTGGTARIAVSSGSQVLSATFSLSQTFSYASSHITSNATLNCVAQHFANATGAGSALSYGIFASSTKGSNQALNITYNFQFST